MNLRVEKRKWDGTLSAVVPATLVDAPSRRGAVAWLIRAGTERRRPAKGDAEIVTHDELWLAVSTEWWVLCGRTDDGGHVTEYVVHAAAPFEPPDGELLRWIDLDLDFQVHGDDVALEDEAQFHEHARSMSYPDEVVRGAWSGISGVAPHYTTGEWPFDGWMDRALAQGRWLDQEAR